jgi:hypothetical protein
MASFRSALEIGWANWRIWLTQVPAIVALAVALASCGDDDGNEVTRTPTVAPSGSPGAALTAGDLADRIANGWKSIKSYRAVTVTGTRLPDDGSPNASEKVTAEIVEEVALPDRRRQIVTSDGELGSEIVAVGGEVYGRGESLPGLSNPNRNPDVWMVIDSKLLGPENQFLAFYESFAEPVAAPYSDLSEAERSRAAAPRGAVEIDGRSCQAFAIADTTMTDELVDVVMSIDKTGLPCAIATTAGGTTTTTTFAFDLPVSIEAPPSPVAAPPENG